MQAMKTVIVLVGMMCVGCAINQRHEVRKPVSSLPALEDVPVASNDHLHKPEPIRHVAAVEEVSDGGLFSGPVSVEELVAFAVAINPEVKAARAHARSLGLRVPQVTSLDDPMLSTTAFLDSIETAAPSSIRSVTSIPARARRSWGEAVSRPSSGI